MKDNQINHTIASPTEQPSVPVPAATVLLVRDNNKKIELVDIIDGKSTSNIINNIQKVN